MIDLARYRFWLQLQTHLFPAWLNLLKAVWVPSCVIQVLSELDKLFIDMA